MMSIRELASALMRTGARLVHVLEPTEGPWANNNDWGDQRAQALPGAPNQPVQVLPKNTRLYGPPAVHTVQLSRGDETPATNADVRARVTYGCGGANNSFDCDWLHGSQFSLVCNSISVRAVTYAPRSTAAYDAGTGSVFLAASVAKGSSTPPLPLTYTEPRVTMQNLEVTDYPVRDFVKSVVLHVQNNNDPAIAEAIDVEFLDAGGGSNAKYDAQVFAGGRAVPIPGQTNLIRVTNHSGGVKLVCLQWLLGL